MMRTIAVLLCLSLCLSALLAYRGGALDPAYAQLPPSSYRPFQLSYSLDGKDYYLTGNATKGINVKSFALTPDVSMEIHLDSAGSNAGEIVLLLPNSMMNNITSVRATAPGVSEDTQIRQSFSNSTHYALQVAIPQGMQNVIIAAAHVAPEFQFTTLTGTLSLVVVITTLAIIKRRNSVKIAYNKQQL